MLVCVLSALAVSAASIERVRIDDVSRAGRTGGAVSTAAAAGAGAAAKPMCPAGRVKARTTAAKPPANVLARLSSRRANASAVLPCPPGATTLW